VKVESPVANDVGLFEPVIGAAPSSWPWALPHHYAANVASESGDVVVGVSADPSGAYREERTYRTDQGRFELVAYWRGLFHVVRARACDSVGEARREAQDWFDHRAVRFLMERGSVVRENAKVIVSGEWPSKWKIETLYDLGCLAAYLYETACQHDGQAAADDFKALIILATPGTEQVVVYLRALEHARQSLSRFLSRRSIAALDAGLRAGRSWLAR